MTDPVRLLETTDPFERDILRSAEQDAGSEASFRRLETALGIGASLAVAASAGAAGSAGAAVSSSKGAGAAGLLALVKWLGVGAVGGAVVTGSIMITRPPERATNATAAAVASPVRAVRHAENGRVIAPEHASVSETDPEPEHPAPRAAFAPLAASAGNVMAAEPDLERAAGHAAFADTTASSAAATARMQSLADEVRFVDGARAALARGAAAEALVALGRHAQEFPDPALGLEVAVLRIEALLATGRRAEAEALGRQLLAKHPTGPYAARVEALLAPRPNP